MSVFELPTVTLIPNGIHHPPIEDGRLLPNSVKNQDGSPTDLIDATVRLFMYIYQGEEKKEFPIFDNQIITESYMQGIVKYPIPDMLLSYEGKVDANVYIDFPDGSHTDNLAFTFNIEKSIIDGDVQLNGEYYFKDFQQLLDGVKQEATDAVNAALTNVDSTIEKANQQINEFVEGATQAIDQTVDEVTEQLQATQTKIDTVSQNVTSAQNNLKAVEDKMNQTNQQIGDLGKLKKMYSNSIDFGGYDYSGSPNIAPNVGFNDFYNNDSQTGYTAKDGVDHIAVTRTADAPPAGKLLNIRTLLPNKTYTLSVDIWADMEVPSGAVQCGFRLKEGAEVRTVWAFINKPVGTNRTTYSVTFTTAANFVTTEESKISLWFDDSAGACTAYLGYNIKIEESPTATPYQPNLLDAPYYLSKAPLGENIADPTKTFPINSSSYKIYEGDTKEELMIGQTYTITLKGTKPGNSAFAVHNDDTIYFGSLKPVEGLTDIWSLTFTPTEIASNEPKKIRIFQYRSSVEGASKIEWLKIEKGDTRTPNISEYKYFGEGLKDSNNPNDYSWDITPEYAEKGLNNTVSLTEPETILGLKNFAEGLQSSGVNVAVEYAKAIDTDKYTKHGAIYLGGCAWLAWETLTFQKTEGYAKGSYIRLGADGNASFTYSDVPNIFGGYLWLGGVCQPDYTDGGFGSYHITVENNFDDARKPIVRFIDSPTTPVKKLAVRGFALVFAPAPTENSQVKEGNK